MDEWKGLYVYKSKYYIQQVNHTMTQKIITEGKVGEVGDKIKFVAKLNDVFTGTTSDGKRGLALYYITEWIEEETGKVLKVIFEDYTSVGKAFQGFRVGNIGFLEATVSEHKENKTVLIKAKLESFF